MIFQAQHRSTLKIFLVSENSQNQVNNIMGSLLSKKKKQVQKESEDMPQSVNSSQICNSKGSSFNTKIRPVSEALVWEKAELAFGNISEYMKMAIEKSPLVNDLIHSDKWIVQDKIINSLRWVNAFEHIQVSPALALHVTMYQSSNHLICNPIKLKHLKKQNKEEQSIQVKIENAIIYADLFSISFKNLKKLKIKGYSAKQPQSITSLQPIAQLYAPLLEQFAADGHPITNARFLRRCKWPFLSQLSLRGNFIIDSHQLGNSLITLANSCHIQSINIAGQYSKEWTEVSWIAKLGFIDAQQEKEMLENNYNYYQRYNNRGLRRVDASLANNKLLKNHTNMITHKFNTSYFENPIVFW